MRERKITKENEGKTERESKNEREKERNLIRNIMKEREKASVR